MSGKVIQGSFIGGQPRWSPSVQPKIAPPAFQARTAVVPPPTAFAGRPSGPPAPAFARQAQPVQRHAAGGAFAVEAGALGIASGGGKPLPDVVRGKMEAALDADFSGVRVHVGPQAERIGAIAFTVGSDIYFAPGRYQPETIQGQQLLGHELAHVVQQRAGRVRNPLGSRLAVVQDRSLEAEADRLGQRAAIAHRWIAQPKTVQADMRPEAPGRITMAHSGSSKRTVQLRGINTNTQIFCNGHTTLYTLPGREGSFVRVNNDPIKGFFRKYKKVVAMGENFVDIKGIAKAKYKVENTNFVLELEMTSEQVSELKKLGKKIVLGTNYLIWDGSGLDGTAYPHLSVACTRDEDNNITLGEAHYSSSQDDSARVTYKKTGDTSWGQGVQNGTNPSQKVAGDKSMESFKALFVQ